MVVVLHRLNLSFARLEAQLEVGEARRAQEAAALEQVAGTATAGRGCPGVALKSIVDMISLYQWQSLIVLHNRTDLLHHLHCRQEKAVASLNYVLLLNEIDLIAFRTGCTS